MFLHRFGKSCHPLAAKERKGNKHDKRERYEDNQQSAITRVTNCWPDLFPELPLSGRMNSLLVVVFQRNFNTANESRYARYFSDRITANRSDGNDGDKWDENHHFGHGVKTGQLKRSLQHVQQKMYWKIGYAKTFYGRNMRNHQKHFNQIDFSGFSLPETKRATTKTAAATAQVANCCHSKSSGRIGSLSGIIDLFSLSRLNALRMS